jgi:predicted Fe-Mo cluster-binding NifX family protein
MKVCVPTENEAGLDGRLSQHFGRTPFFTVVDGDTGEWVVVPNGRSDHQHGQCGEAAAAFAGHGVEAVVCRGVGRGALVSLQTRGLAVFVTEAETVTQAVAALRAGRLKQALLHDACGGGHGHGHDHGPGHGHGHGAHGPMHDGQA